MQQNACNTNGSEQLFDATFPSIATAVSELATHSNLQRLTEIARQRLDRLASAAPGQRLRGLRDPAEFVNQAIEQILCGRRKARTRNLKDLNSFQNFVQGVMQSIINHELERIVREGEQVPLDSSGGDNESNGLSSNTDVIREIALAEAKESLFPRLREYAKNNPRLLQAITAWEESWSISDRIPKCNLTDKQTHAVRVAAREVLRRAAAKEGIVAPTGKEPFTF